MSTMGQHILLVGGGHAQLETLRALPDIVDQGHRVTLVSDSPHHYYSGMGPGMLGGMYDPEELRFDVRRQAKVGGAEFKHDTLTRVDADKRTAIFESGASIQYDVASLCIGSVSNRPDLSAGNPNAYTVKPIVNLLRARNDILERLETKAELRFVVVGGGPAGVEVTANLLNLVRQAGGAPLAKLICRGQMLSRFPERARRLARNSLEKRGTTILENTGVKNLNSHQILMSPSRQEPYDFAFIATGVVAPHVFTKSGLPTDESGALCVNHKLQSVEYPELFGGGDCIAIEGEQLSKVGVHAVYEAPVLRHNLPASLADEPLKRYEPVKRYMLVMNMGDGTGIASKWGLTWDGRVAFIMKDRIDRKFMREYQI